MTSMFLQAPSEAHSLLTPPLKSQRPLFRSPKAASCPFSVEHLRPGLGLSHCTFVNVGCCSLCTQNNPSCGSQCALDLEGPRRVDSWVLGRSYPVETVSQGRCSGECFQVSPQDGRERTGQNLPESLTCPLGQMLEELTCGFPLNSFL